MGLVNGEGFAVDANVLEANSSRYHGKAPDDLVCESIALAPSFCIDTASPCRHSISGMPAFAEANCQL